MKQKFLILAVALVGGFTTTSAQTKDGGISQQMLQEIRKEQKSCPAGKALSNAIAGLSIDELAKNYQLAAKPLDTNFSIETKKQSITVQKSSGRCWMFAALNTFRHKMISDLNLENFELSQAHTFFWDKYEKSNWFLEQVIATADQELGSRKVKFLLDVPQQDGGQWDMVVALFENMVSYQKQLILNQSHQAIAVN